jgi:hypothetical protein
VGVAFVARVVVETEHRDGLGGFLRGWCGRTSGEQEEDGWEDLIQAHGRLVTDSSGVLRQRAR